MNEKREAWLEGLIYAQPDELLHTVPSEGASPEKRRGQRPREKTSIEEIRLCLECRRAECELDHHKRCRRMTKFLAARKRKEGTGNDEGT